MNVNGLSDAMTEEKLEENAKEMPKSSVISSPQKEGAFETETMEDSFSSPTPVKTKEPSRLQTKEEITEIPEKYRMLSELFDRMISSLRLLSLRKRAPYFKNIISQVEILTGRKFLVMNLAQIKFIVPEALQIEKILMHDEKTKCMVPEMKIELLFDVVEDHSEESKFVALSNLFSSRLRDFHLKHPEDTEVPEAVLPEPFNRISIPIKADPIPAYLSSSSEMQILNPSHFSLSFSKHFDQKTLTSETEKNHILSLVTCVDNADNELPKSLPHSFSDASKVENTPMKLETNSFLVETPLQSTPMRSISPNRSVLTCEDEEKKHTTQKPKQTTATAKKVLDFYGMDDSSVSNKKVSVCLFDLVQLIHQVFQSVNFRSITKEELVQKIIMNDCEIDDFREVEIQMENLEKLVPDWFFKKLTSSGDILYNVKRVSDLKFICERVDVI